MFFCRNNCLHFDYTSWMTGCKPPFYAGLETLSFKSSLRVPCPPPKKEDTHSSIFFLFVQAQYGTRTREGRAVGERFSESFGRLWFEGGREGPPRKKYASRQAKRTVESHVKLKKRVAHSSTSFLFLLLLEFRISNQLPRTRGTRTHDLHRAYSSSKIGASFTP